MRPAAHIFPTATQIDEALCVLESLLAISPRFVSNSLIHKACWPERDGRRSASRRSGLSRRDPPCRLLSASTDCQSRRESGWLAATPSTSPATRSRSEMFGAKKMRPKASLRPPRRWKARLSGARKMRRPDGAEPSASRGRINTKGQRGVRTLWFRALLPGTALFYEMITDAASIATKLCLSKSRKFPSEFRGDISADAFSACSVARDVRFGNPNKGTALPLSQLRRKGRAAREDMRASGEADRARRGAPPPDAV